VNSGACRAETTRTRSPSVVGLTDREYKRAVPSLLSVPRTRRFAPKKKIIAGLSREAAETHIGSAAAAPFDRAAWEGEIQNFPVLPDTQVYFATVRIQSQTLDSSMGGGGVIERGIAIVSPNASTRLSWKRRTRADDGMDFCA